MSKQLLSIPTTNYLSTYDVANNHVQSACDSHADLWKLIEICERHIAGEKPQKQEDIKKRGASWTSNFNYNKARAKIETGTAKSVAKISLSLALGYCSFRNFKESDRPDKIFSFLEDDQRRGIVAAALGCALSNTLAKETRLSGWLNEVENPAYSYGYCALIFNKHDWMPDPTHPRKIAFEPNTKPHEINSYVVFRKMRVKELYNRWIEAHNESIIDTEEDGTKETKIVSSGWNLAALEEVLLKAFKGTQKDGRAYETWESVMPAFKENPSLVMSQTSDISIAKIYYKELDNTLSEVYIPWNNDWQKSGPITSSEPASAVGMRLFSKNHGPYKQNQWVALIRDSGFSSTGYIQDYRGIAKYAVEDSYRYNKHRNNTNDKMMFVGSPMFESSGTTTADKLKITAASGYLILSPGAQFLEKNFNFDISSHLNMLSFEEREYNRDTQQFDASIEGRLTSRPNKGEVMQVTQEVQVTDSAKGGVKLRDYSAVFESVIKRIVSVDCQESDPGYNGKKRFNELVKQYLPWLVETDEDVKKLILSIDSYTLEPVTTNLETITIAIQMAETPFARNRFKRMLLLAKGLPIEEVNIAVPLITDKFANVEDQRIAAFENDLFFLSSDKQAYGTDDHIVHIESHFAKSQKVIEGFKQGSIKPSDAFAYLSNSLAHSQLHIDMLGQDPILNKKAQEYLGMLKQLDDARQQIGKAAQQLAEAEANKQPQMNPETAEELRQKDIKMMSDNQRKDFLAAERTKQAEEKIEKAHELGLVRAENDAAIKRVKEGVA